MSEYSEAFHQMIVMVDVVSFSHPSRSTHHQVTVHGGLENLLRKGFDEAGIDLSECDVEDRGDGKLILVRPSVPKIRLVDQLTHRLLAQLRRYNNVHSVESSIRLRMALHAGEIRHGDNGKVGPALNFAARILDAEEAKKALNVNQGILAVIVSDQIYRDVVREDPAAGPENFKPVRVDVKETRDVAWLWMPDAPLPWALPEPEPHKPVVRELLPEDVLGGLRERLTGLRVPQLPMLVRRAAGSGAPPAPPGADAWEVFRHLTDVNAGADGFPPALAFVEFLVELVGKALGSVLTRWLDEQASRLRLEGELEQLRACKPTMQHDPRLHLMIVVQHDGIDSDRLLISHWRQDDPDEWPPARGEQRSATVDDLERQVDELVVEAERAWGIHEYNVALELVLPRGLLNLPVHSWCKEHASGDPRPLCLDYTLVVRSLERMTKTEWHRPWRKRWSTLTSESASAQRHFVPSTGPGNPDELETFLSRETDYVSVVLSAPPPRVPSKGDQLTATLRSGVPVVLWHREGEDADRLREVVAWLTDAGFQELPRRTQTARQDLYLTNTITGLDVELVRDLVLLWDDPTRLPIRDELVG